MRVVSLRHRLLLLTAAALLPLALMSGIALRALLEQQRQQTEQSTLDLARAIGTAVDTELRLTISALQTLASSEAFVEGRLAEDPAEFSRWSRRVLESRPEWLALMLADPSGSVVFNSSAPVRGEAQEIVERASFDRLVLTGLPAVGTLAIGSGGRHGLAVRVPVMAGGQMRQVLTGVLNPEALLQVIRRQRVPGDWTIAVLDADTNVVARSRDHARALGTRATASLQAMLKEPSQEIVGSALTLEGERVITALIRLQPSDWSVALGVPQSIPESALQQSAMAYGGGLLLSLGIGGLAAFLVARGIARPIARLRESASQLGGGSVSRPVASGMAEIDAVSDALVASARARAGIESEREGLLAAEREARAVAEKAQRRLEMLAGAGALLARSLEEHTTLEAIASVVVPGMADVCRIDLLDEHGVLQRKLTHHRDPERGREIAAMVQNNKVAPDTPGSFLWAIATGQTYLANHDSPEAFGLQDPTYREFAQLAGMRALCVIPLVAGGRTLGALAALQTDSGRVLTVDDSVLLSELARRAAMALENVRLYAESKSALHQAEVANRAKDEFLAMLGHELRNPLAPIVTSLELMARRDPQALATERRIIERQVRHLARLVDDLLDVSRIASGKIHLSLERVDLRQVVGRALELAEPALRQRPQPPVVTLPGGPVWVTGDPMRLAQVVSNLLGNAAKFTAGTQRIAVLLESGASDARIVVSDEGAGIAAELLPLIFERFVQGEQELERAAGGLGLGLAIASNLVGLHGGTIRAASDGPGRGSSFTVTLPLASAAAAPPMAPPPERVDAASVPYRILLVDDNEDAAEALQAVLGLQGHEVLTAGSAEAALALLERFVPNLALLDIGLPKMNGYELARVLRADPRLAGVRLLALTGYGRDPDRRRALESGFDGHFVKPVDIDLLLARVDELMQAGAETVA